MSIEGDLLGETQAKQDMVRVFGSQLSVIADIRDWGLSLMRRVLAGQTELSDLVVVGAMHRQVVATLDATLVGLKAANPTAAFIGLRSLTEAVWGLGWALKGDTAWKAHCFLTLDLRRRRQGHLQRLPGNPEYDSFMAVARASHAGFAIPSDQVQRSRDELPKVEAMLKRSPYRECDEAFDRVRGRQRWDPPWYAAAPTGTGPRSLRQLAAELGHDATYVTIYSSLSRVTHASSLSAHLDFQTDGVLIEPIRSLGEARFVITLAPYLAVHAYTELIQSYRPGEVASFARRHVESWKPTLDATPVVSIEPNAVSLTDPWSGGPPPTEPS